MSGILPFGLSIKARLRCQQHIRQAQSLAKMPFPSIGAFLGSPEKCFSTNCGSFMCEILPGADCGVSVCAGDLCEIESRGSPFPHKNKPDKLFGIVEVVIIADYTRTVIYDTVAFVGFKAVKQLFDAVSLDKKSKSVWLDFSEQPLAAVLAARKTASDAIFNAALPVYAPALVRTFLRLAAAAMFIFGAKTARKPTPCDPEFPFHFITSVCFDFDIIIH